MAFFEGRQHCVRLGCTGYRLKTKKMYIFLPTVNNMVGGVSVKKNELTETIASEQFAIDATQIQKDDLIDLIHSFTNADNRTLVNTFVTRLTLYDTYAILAYDSSGDNTINIPLTDTDFVHDATSLHQRVAGTKFYIHHATLYIYVPLVA